MAAPLAVREKKIGVIYVDSRLMKGLFTGEHLGVLQAIGNQVAIALETARAARERAAIEAERSAMEKDLEVTQAVQTLCLPRERTLTSGPLSLLGYYQPALRAGGDWMWYESLSPGSMAVLVGDVTGHGAGSAMISACAASAYRLLRRRTNAASLEDLLTGVDETLRDIGGRDFLMTMSALEIDANAGALRWLNAGAPPILVMRASGKIDVLSSPGNPLGSTQFLPGKKGVSFSAGDRAFVFTDGVVELELADRPGQPLGMRRLHQIFGETRGKSLDEASAMLQARLGLSHRKTSGADEMDDITFVLVDWTVP
jgi:serine phosphatase RsbU (regulator of sigma subunit)